MPDMSGPFDSAAFLQAGWYRDRGHLDPSGVAGGPAASAGAGDLGLTASGFTLTLALGRAHVRGAYYERTGSAWTDTVPANTSTVGPRYDLIVLRRDLTTKTVTPVRLQGTPAASPVDPTLTLVEDGVFDMPLHRVTVPANSGTPLVITDLRRALGSGGNDIRLGSTTPSGSHVGEYRDHPTYGLERWDGARWLSAVSPPVNPGWIDLLRSDPSYLWAPSPTTWENMPGGGPFTLSVPPGRVFEVIVFIPAVRIAGGWIHVRLLMNGVQRAGTSVSGGGGEVWTPVFLHDALNINHAVQQHTVQVQAYRQGGTGGELRGNFDHVVMKYRLS